MRRIILSLLLVGLCVAGVWYAFSLRQPMLPVANDDSCTPSDILGGPFTLTDHNGNRVTDQTYRGKYLLVEFGFTFCPDICPLQLGTASAALKQLGDKASRIQPLFITVDPERDTVGALKDYMQSFPRFTGLTGSAAEIDAIAKAYKIYYAKVPNKEVPEAYTMDHTVRIFLMDPDGKFLSLYSKETPAELAAQLNRCIR